MKILKINLKEVTKASIPDDVILEAYFNDDNEEIIYDGRPGMLVLPGGGYSMCSTREGEPIALRFMAEGFNCFVLYYTCKKPYPLPQFEVAIAMQYINNHAEEFNIKSGCVSVVGFSAGGHLAASYGYLYKNFSNELEASEKTLKPFAIVLGYPVITMTKLTEGGTATVITDGMKEDLISLLSVEKHVDYNYPPTYIWTTKEDTCVDPINSEYLVQELKKNNINHKYDLFEHGIHGGSLCNRAVYDYRTDLKALDISENRIWIQNASDFIYSLIK